MKISSMGDIFHISHNTIREIWEGQVEITEKVDGSFFSFMLDEDGELHMRSKGQELHFDAPSSKMFQIGMEQVQERKELLVPGFIYRGEYLMKPKHNSLAYDRVPTGHVALFDIERSMGDHMNSLERRHEANRIGFDATILLYEGYWTLPNPVQELNKFLDRTSFLGGQKIEGVVVKNYNKFLGGKVMMGKLVSEAFKEVHNKEWRKENPTKGDIVDQLVDKYTSPARWDKAIIHLKERGQLVNGPQDIGPLLKEIPADILKEEEDAIKEALFKAFWPQIARRVTSGFPEYYKQRLIEGDVV